MNHFRRDQLRFVYFWMGALLVFYIILRFIPIFNTFRLSFFKWDLISNNKPFIGLENYRKLLKDENFTLSIKNTLIFAFFVVNFTLISSLFIATILQKKFFLKGIYESLFFLPYVVAVVPAALAWKFIFDPTNGALNEIISVFGFAKQAWLINEKTALGSIMAVTVWQRIGYNLVIFSVGLGEIPRDFYEAAYVDGASSFQVFRKITFPLLLPITTYLLIMNTIEALNIFTPVFVMTTGTQSAPASAVKVLVMDIYQNAFRFFQMGYASAESVCLFMIVLIVSLFQFTIVKKRKK